MIPTNSNRTSPCDPVSSNCVIWQGPDLKFDNPGGCINICNGDTISDVVAKLAERLCDLIEESCVCDPDMTSIILGPCLPGGTPLTIQDLTQAIIDYLCSITPGGSSEQICDVPVCFSQLISTDWVNNPITQLPICDFANELAMQICGIITSISIIEGNISTLSDRIEEVAALAVIVPPVLQMKSECVMDDTITLYAIDDIVNQLEFEFCQLKAAVGEPNGDIAIAMSNICITSGTKTVNNPDVDYGGEYAATWIGSPSTMAQSQQDLWVVVCDLHKAIQGIHTNCCPKPCEGLVYDFTAQVTSGGSLLNINWNLSNFPPPYHDCTGGSLVTVTDTTSLSTSAVLQPAQFEPSYVGQDIDVSMLTPNVDYDVQVDFCITDGAGNTCQFTLIKTVPGWLPCPNPVVLGPNATNNIAFAFNNVETSNVTYFIYAVDTTSLVQTGTTMTFNETGTSALSGTLNGLAVGTLYNVVVEMWPTALPAQKVVCQVGQTVTDTILCVDTSIPAVSYNPVVVLPVGLALGVRKQAGNDLTYNINDDGAGLLLVNELTTPAPGPNGNTPTGTDLGSDTIDCGGMLITQANCIWWLVDAFNDSIGNTYYAYAAWNTLTFALDQVFACCTCPTVMFDDYTLDCQIAGTVTGTPVSTTFGPATFVVPSSPPQYGNVNLINPATGEWEYQHPGGVKQNDSFDISVVTPCGNHTSTVKIEIRTTAPEATINTDIWVFINTTTVGPGDATDIATEVNTWYVNEYQAVCAGIGSLYLVCTPDPQVLSYSRAIISLGTEPLGPFPETIGGGYPANQLPSNWAGFSGPGAEPASIQVLDTFTMIFCNEGNSLAVPYTSPTLAEAFIGAELQPTLSFYADWDNLVDLRDQTGTGTWGAFILGTPALQARLQAAGTVQRRTAMFTVNLNPLGAEGAWIFMLFGAGSATIMPEKEYRAKNTSSDCCLAPTQCLDSTTSAIVNPYALGNSPVGANLTAGGLETVNFFTALSADAGYNILTDLGTDIKGMCYGYPGADCPNP